MDEKTRTETLKKLADEMERVNKGERVPHEVLSITLEGGDAVLWRSVKVLIPPEMLIELEKAIGKKAIHDLHKKLSLFMMLD